jgi:hypothetical protein
MIDKEALKGAIGAEYQKSPWDEKGISMPPPAAPVQEPVAWVYSQGAAKVVSMNYVPGVRAIPLYTTPPAAPDLQAELDATNRQVEILSDALAESRREVARLKAVQDWKKLPPEEPPLVKWAKEQSAPVQEPVAPDYAWPTFADYEKDVGFKVNDAFKMAWTMARTTNALFTQMEKNT